jgi:ribosome-binding factor A
MEIIEFIDIEGIAINTPLENYRSVISLYCVISNLQISEDLMHAEIFVHFGGRIETLLHY